MTYPGASLPQVDPLVSLRARQLQNEYAYAIDTRDWNLFRTLFADDVQAIYPNQSYGGLESWLESFIPIHDRFGWTRHEVTNHVVGQDDDGVWAACYGFVEWCPRRSSDEMTTARTIYRDRLRQEGERWVIFKRTLTLISKQSSSPVQSGMQMLDSLEEVVRR